MALTNTSYASNEQTIQAFRGALKAEIAIIFPTVDILTSPAILFAGSVVRSVSDGKLYLSNGTAFEQIQGSSGGGSETAITIKIITRRRNIIHILIPVIILWFLK